MSRVDTALRALGKLTAGLFGAGLLAFTGYLIASRFEGVDDLRPEIVDRLDDVEQDARDGLLAVARLETLVADLEAHVARLSAAEKARVAADALSAATEAKRPPEPARAPRKRPRTPEPDPAASSHWRF